MLAIIHLRIMKHLQDPSQVALSFVSLYSRLTIFSISNINCNLFNAHHSKLRVFLYFKFSKDYQGMRIYQRILVITHACILRHHYRHQTMEFRELIWVLNEN
jgi:hypothetical protein